MKNILILVCFFSATMLANAGGFQVNGQGAKALGIGGAFTAYNKDASAAYYNLGAVAMLDSGRHISAGAAMVMPRMAFKSTGTGIIYEMESQNLFPAYLYVTLPVKEKLFASLSVNSPFMLANKWENSWEGRSVSQEMRLNTYYFQPGLSYKLNNNFSLGAGVVYGISDLLMRRNIGETNTDVQLKAKASGFGFNAGIFGKLLDELSFGITYRSEVAFNYNNGDATFTNVPSSLSSQYQNQKFQTAITMPSTLSVGLTNRINKRVVASFEFNLTGWSSYDSLNVNYENGNTADTRAGRRYEDAMAFRAGAEFQALDNLTIRGGVYYDETPVRDEYISPDLPDGSRLGFTAGLSYAITSNFEVDAAAFYDTASDRNAKTTVTTTTVSNVGGTFRSVTTGLSLGLSYKF